MGHLHVMVNHVILGVPSVADNDSDDNICLLTDDGDDEVDC